MNQDPFGNLRDWGRVLDMLDELAGNGKLEEYQSALIRILRFKGNWRLREEALKRVGSFQTPCDELIFQVLSILADDNIYYEARILATEALLQMFKNVREGFSENINMSARKVTERLRMTPQPVAFDNALTRLYSNIGLLST
jgi:hypothetical protein